MTEGQVEHTIKGQVACMTKGQVEHTIKGQVACMTKGRVARMSHPPA